MNNLTLGETEVLLDMFSGVKPGDAIVAQEAREQSRMVAASRLPKECDRFWRGRDPIKTTETYAELGIKVLSEYDDLFFNVELPAGWTLKPSDHSMWSYLYDEKNRKRLSVFYKGAFYDRNAHAGVVSRFQYRTIGADDSLAKTKYEYKTWEDTMSLPVFGAVFMDEKMIWSTEEKAIDPETKDRGVVWSYDSLKTKLLKECHNWLNTNYPKWEDAKAQWDY